MAGFATSPAAGAANGAAFARQAPTVVRGGDPEKAQKTAREFEAFFVGQVLEHMFKDVPSGGFFGGGQAETVFRSMLLQHYGNAIAERGGFGIADMVSRDMLKAQEVK